MRLKILSGGQTGADQAALRAARAAGLETGGYAPLGWLTEAGAAPWLADYGLVELESPRYQDRTEANVRACFAVLWFGDADSPGGRLTLRLAARHGKTVAWVGPGSRPSQVADVLSALPVAVLLVAGNRESSSPGIGARVERFLAEVFRRTASGG